MRHRLKPAQHELGLTGVMTRSNVVVLSAAVVALVVAAAIGVYGAIAGTGHHVCPAHQAHLRSFAQAAAVCRPGRTP